MKISLSLTKKQLLRLGVGALGLTLVATISTIGVQSWKAGRTAPTKPLVAIPAWGKAYPHVIEKDSTLSDSLRAFGVQPHEIHDFVLAAKKIKNLGMIQPGTRFRLELVPGPLRALQEIHFKFSPLESLSIVRLSTGGWQITPITETAEIRLVTYMGVVNSSLWESAEEAKMDPSLIAELTDIFGWQIDFAREVRDGDRWRLTIEQKFAHGEAIGWGAIMAAEYLNVDEMYSAALFRKNGRDFGYYAPDGTSLRRMFLKSPIAYSRISSRFKMHRFHPILGITRPHLGVDYAAAKGTPVKAVGDGVIALAGYRGGGGNTIKIRHNAVYQTAYKHLSGYASGVHVGVHVRQGQVIGYVGSTGLATGPHLHFEFWEGGRYVDPLSRRFPSADPVPHKDLVDFKAQAASFLATLPTWDKPVKGGEVAREARAGMRAPSTTVKN